MGICIKSINPIRDFPNMINVCEPKGIKNSINILFLWGFLSRVIAI